MVVIAPNFVSIRSVGRNEIRAANTRPIRCRYFAFESCFITGSECGDWRICQNTRRENNETDRNANGQGFCGASLTKTTNRQSAIETRLHRMPGAAEETDPFHEFIHLTAPLRTEGNWLGRVSAPAFDPHWFNFIYSRQERARQLPCLRNARYLQILVELFVTLPAILEMLQHSPVSQLRLAAPNRIEDSHMEIKVRFSRLIGGDLRAAFEK